MCGALCAVFIKGTFMDIRKTIAIAAASCAAFTSAFAETNEDYIKTFGMFVYQNGGLKELQLNPAEFNLFIEGIKAAYEGKPMPKNVAEYGQKMMEYLKSRADAYVAEQIKKSQAQNDAFWKTLDTDKEVVKTSTGLAYKITKKGDGATPKENSDVVINYTGKLIDGTVFDSTDKHGKSAEFNLANVIPGFREGLQKIAKGGKATLYIPAKLGYGEQSTPNIPPNSTLIFDVELVDVK